MTADDATKKARAIAAAAVMEARTQRTDERRRALNRRRGEHLPCPRMRCGHEVYDEAMFALDRKIMIVASQGRFEDFMPLAVARAHILFAQRSLAPWWSLPAVREYWWRRVKKSQS